MAIVANPASVYCAPPGGTPVIEQETDGERTYCILPDGTRVTAWE